MPSRAAVVPPSQSDILRDTIHLAERPWLCYLQCLSYWLLESSSSSDSLFRQTNLEDALLPLCSFFADQSLGAQWMKEMVSLSFLQQNVPFDVP